VRGDRRLDNRPAGCEKITDRSSRRRCDRSTASSGDRRCVEHDAGARDDDEMGKLENLTPAMPRREPEERIGADDQRQVASAILVAQLLERSDRIAAALARNFPRIDLEAGMARNRELDHGEPMRRGTAGADGAADRRPE
jgi:hypothetical protein